jgi:hypothetical protein
VVLATACSTNSSGADGQHCFHRIARVVGPEAILQAGNSWCTGVEGSNTLQYEARGFASLAGVFGVWQVFMHRAGVHFVRCASFAAVPVQASSAHFEQHVHEY